MSSPQNPQIIQELLKKIKNTPFYSENINLNFKIFKETTINIKASTNRDHQFVSKCPQIKFSLSSEILNKLKNDILKSRKSKSGILTSYESDKFRHIMDHMHYTNSADDQDMGAWQQAEDAFCVGFYVQKQTSFKDFKIRLESQLQKCLDKKLQVYYTKNANSLESKSQINHIQKALYNHLRIYILFQRLNSNSVSINRLIYYPNIKFLVKVVKISPMKFAQVPQLERVLSFHNDFDYGYLSLTKEKRFLLVNRVDPDIAVNPIIGVWMSAEKFDKQSLKYYFWIVIMQFLRNIQIVNKVSLNMQKSGIIFTIQKPQKISSYIFQASDQAKWNFKFSSESTFDSKIPQQYCFTDQQVIMEEDRQQSDMQSIQNKSIMKNQHANSFYPQQKKSTLNSQISQEQNPSSYSNNNNKNQNCDISKGSISNQSLKSKQDEKQVEIRLLKKELQYYKNRCEMLEKTLCSPQMMQLQAIQMMNQMPNMNMQMRMGMQGFNPLMMVPNNNYPQNMQQYNTGMPQKFQSGTLNTSNNNNYHPNNQQGDLRNSAKNLTNPSLYNSKTSLQNSNRILNESDVFGYQPELPPEPVQMSASTDFAFNKKKTFQYSQEQSVEDQQLRIQDNFDRKQSMKKKKSSQQDSSFGQQDKLKEIDLEYKNISFSQEHSFDNDLNTTHKFASFQAEQSEIFNTKSPQFKRFNSSKDSNGQNKQPNYNRQFSHQFSFDKKDEEILVSSKARKQMESNLLEENQKNEDKIAQKYKNQYERKDKNLKQDESIGNDKQIYQRQKGQNKDFISRFQAKYSESGPSSSGGKNQKYAKKEVHQNEEQYYKIELNSKANQSKNNNSSSEKQDISKKITQVQNTSQTFRKNLFNGSSDQRDNQKYDNEQNSISKNKLIQPLTDKNRYNTTNKDFLVSPSLSRVTARLPDSDSDSDEQLKNIAMRYKK